VLSGICIAAALAGAAALWLADATRVPFFVAAALCGGLSLTIYSLALSHMNDHFEPAQMVGVSGTMILLNGVGAIVGPLAVAGAMQAWGPRAFFGSLVAMHAAFAAYTLWRKRRRAPVAGHAKTHYVAAQPQAPTGQLTAGAEHAAKQTE
jgi:MFS family permease